MRSDRVVLPESMCAEMPMLRMRSMFATSVSALLQSSLEQALREREFPRGPPPNGAALPNPKWGERQAAAATPVQAASGPCLHAEPIGCRGRAEVARARGGAAVPRLTIS